MDSYGSKNGSIKFGILETSDNGFIGFGAFAKEVLGGLIIMDEKGLLPYIDIKSKVYTESHKVNGTWNAFEYYFLQPCDVIEHRHIPRNEILQSANVEFISREEAADVLDGHLDEHGFYSVFDNQKLLERAAMAVKKYIRVNPFSGNIYKEVWEILGSCNDTIGIQVRRAGFQSPAPYHPVPVEPTEHLALFKKVRNNRKAFLATDDEAVIELFSCDEEYKKGNIFWYDNILRTPKEQSADNKSMIFSKEDRDFRKYKLGYEVLKEIITLSYCESLIAGFSNVALLANIVKMSRGERYKDYLIIDKGIWGEEYKDLWEYNIEKIRMEHR